MKTQLDKVIYYENYRFPVFSGGNHTVVSLVPEDTFTFAAKCGADNVACLNFASHKRPGGGYRSVMERRGPIRTQEEDLFRRSDLPEIMDNNNIHPYYPMLDMAGFYCECTVSKDNKLDPVTPFKASIISVPAVVNPGNSPERMELVSKKAKLILDIAADNGHDIVVLGAWGCGIFNNEPKLVAEDFKRLLRDYFCGRFKEVVFAIPCGVKGAGASSLNYTVFESVFAGGLSL